MPWLYLIVGGLFEVGWPIGFALSNKPGRFASGLSLAAVSMALSVGLLWLAQRSIPIGTAYAVWTGIGTAGTFVVGVLFLGESSSVLRWGSACLILIGVVGLHMAHEG